MNGHALHTMQFIQCTLQCALQCMHFYARHEWPSSLLQKNAQREKSVI